MQSEQKVFDFESEIKPSNVIKEEHTE